MQGETARDARARLRDEVRRALLSPEREAREVRLARASRLAVQGVSKVWTLSSNELDALRALKVSIQEEQPDEEGASLPPIEAVRLETGLQALEEDHQRVIEALLALNSGCQRSTLVLTLDTLLEEEKAEGALHLLQPYWPQPVVLQTPPSTPAIPATPATPTTPTPAATPAATLAAPATPNSARDSFSQGLSLSLASEARAPPSHPQWPGEKVSVLNLSWVPTSKLKTQTYSAQQLVSLDLVYKGEGQSVLTWWTRVREQASLNKWGSSDTLNHIMVFFLSKSIKLAFELHQQTKAVRAEEEKFNHQHHQITRITDLLLYLRERYEKEEDLRRPYHLFFARKQKGGERLRDYFHGLQVLQNEVRIRGECAGEASHEICWRTVR